MGKLSKIKKNNCQNSYKHLVDKEYQHMLKSLRNDNSTYRFFTEGDFAHRRKTAVLSTLKFLESKLQSIDPDYGIEAFAEHSFVPYGNYEGLEQEKDLSLGAALWILGSLRRNNKLVEACEIISNYGVDYDDWYLPPNFSHPCFSSDLINSLVDIIKKRYSHNEHSGTIITLGNAKRIRPDKVYTQIIELLPKTEVEQACRTFKEKIYDVYRYKIENEKLKVLRPQDKEETTTVLNIFPFILLLFIFLYIFELLFEIEKSSENVL